MKMSYTVYILYSKNIDRYYVGFSQDVKTRLHYHNLGRKGWTKRGIPWEIVFTFPCKDKKQAMILERKIKAQKSRTYIENLIIGAEKLS